MGRLPRALLVAAAVALVPALTTLAPREAVASVSYDSPYTYEQTFGTALRLVRVDMGFKVTEKDADAGYLLFEYTSPEAGKPSSGSIELVRNNDGVHVTVQLPSMPSYHEQVLLDHLVKKLQAEHGDPPHHEKPAPPPSDADAGADGGSAG
jgi:hypothetical protein